MCRHQALLNAASVGWDERLAHRQDFENLEQLPSHLVGLLIAGLVESN
jgi:hypothetical protein